MSFGLNIKHNKCRIKKHTFLWKISNIYKDRKDNETCVPHHQLQQWSVHVHSYIVNVATSFAWNHNASHNIISPDNIPYISQKDKDYFLKDCEYNFYKLKTYKDLLFNKNNQNISIDLRNQ